MKNRLIASVLIIVMLLCCCFIAQADDGEKKSGLFFYKLKGNGTAVITGFDWQSNRKEDIYIPRMVDGYTVTEIGEKAFTKDDAMLFNPLDSDAYKSVIYGQEVSVVIPDTVTSIRSKAFFCTKIKSVTIPESVLIIEGGAFSGCVSLNQFSVSSSSTTFATIDGILYNKKEKALIAIPMAKYGTYPFKEDPYKTNPEHKIISIPEGIRSIGEYAFYGMGLAGIQDGFVGVAFPSSLETLSPHAFENSCFGSLENYSIWGIELHNADVYMQSEVSLSNVKEIGDYAFYNSSFSLVKLDFSNVEIIGDYAFAHANPGYVNAFNYNLRGEYNSNAMNSIAFPETLTYIGKGAFSTFNAFPIFELDLSKTQIKEIPDYAFYEFCYNLVTDSPMLQRNIEVLLPETLNRISDFAFYGAYQYGILYIYRWADPFPFSDIHKPISHIMNIDMPNAVTYIGKNAFSYTSLNIKFGEDSQLKKIDTDAFSEIQIYNKDKRLDLPNQLQEIGNNAFDISRDDYLYQDAIAILSIPSSVKSIGDSICDRSVTSIEAENESYAALYAEQNGISFIPVGGEDTSWLND